MKAILLFLTALLTLSFAGCVSEEETDYLSKIIFNDLSESVSSQESLSNDFYDIGQEITIVHVEMSYAQYEPWDKSIIKDSNADDIIKLNRELGKKYHQSKNEEVALKLGIDKEKDFYSSTYTPFISFQLDVTDVKGVISRLEDYAKYDEVRTIYVDVVDTASINSDMSTMFSDIGLGTYSSYTDYNGYDGTDVVIGILEYGGDCVFGSGGLVEEDHANFAGVELEVRNEWYCNEQESNHATLVASIAAGNLGIARGAKLLSVQTDALGYASEFDWMIDRDVNVVNMSLSDAGQDGYYSGNARYLDFVVRNYWVSIVNSAGNNSGNIATPGTGYNVITVGSLSSSSTLSSFSSWEENFTISKPNLVAPGSSISAGAAGPSSGTSFAAPHVTGTIALMMDRSPTLKAHPEVVMAILQATADISSLSSTYNSYDSSGLEETVGAGMLRVDRAVDSVYRRSYTTLTNNDKYKTNIREIRIYLNSGDDFQASLVWLKNIIHTPYGLLTLSSTNLDLRLYNPSGMLVDFSSSSGYNAEYIRHTANVSGYYTLTVYQSGNYATIGSEYIGVAYWYY